MQPDKLLKLIIWVAIAFIAAFFFLSCTTTKNITSDKQQYDYQLYQRLIDSNRVLREENARMEQELKEAEYATADFDSTDCPDIKIPDCPAMMNKDSVNRLVADLNGAIRGLNNKVKFYADGSIEYTGRLKQFKYANEKQSKTITELSNKIETLETRLAEAKKNVRVVTEEKTLHKKVTVFPWYFWLITGAFALLFLNAKFKLV